jgi:hypothetical protein
MVLYATTVYAVVDKLQHCFIPTDWVTRKYPVDVYAKQAMYLLYCIASAIGCRLCPGSSPDCLVVFWIFGA